MWLILTLTIGMLPRGMTTDTMLKAASRRLQINGKTVTISGISKGAGMIRPNMATMLGFMATDAGIAEPLLRQLVLEAADQSFNCISVDGDTSTNDSFIMISSGQSGVCFADAAEPGYAALREAMIAVAVELARAIIRDGEGATKFITISTEGGKDYDECKRVGYAIGHSPLVKNRVLPLTPIWGAFSRPSATPGSTTLMSIACASGWPVPAKRFWSLKRAGGRRRTAKSPAHA